VISGPARVLEYDLHLYRRVWRGSVVVAFLSPLLFLAAMGLGLGGLVNRSAGGVNGVAYILFLAPGLMATTTMQTASSESTYPILAKVYWERTYEAMLSTPLRVRDLVFGELAWLVVRLTLVAVLFFAVMLVFRIPRGPEAALAIPAAVLNGLAFATPILAFTATQTRDTSFSAIQRFLIMPLFLFAGAFFPIAQLPQVLQAVAWLTPLAHGVSLVRGLTLGTLTQSGALVDIGVLLAYTLAGGVGAAITFRRRLIK